MEEFLLVILLGMVVYVSVGVLIALFLWLYETEALQGVGVNVRLQLLQLSLHNPGRRLAVAIVLTILLGVSPWLMDDYFLLGIILFVSSVLVLAVMRGLNPHSASLARVHH